MGRFISMGQPEMPNVKFFKTNRSKNPDVPAKQPNPGWMWTQELTPRTDQFLWLAHDLFAFRTQDMAR
jgi:hypothetical protein